MQTYVPKYLFGLKLFFAVETALFLGSFLGYKMVDNSQGQLFKHDKNIISSLLYYISMFIHIFQKDENICMITIQKHWKVIMLLVNIIIN